MSSYQDNSIRASGLARLAIYGVAGLLVLVGLAGLVLPIIPGLLFLFFALWLLSKVSTRCAAWLHNNPHTAGQVKFWRRTRGLSLAQHARLLGWLAASAVVRGLTAIGKGWRNLRERPR